MEPRKPLPPLSLRKLWRSSLFHQQFVGTLAVYVAVRICCRHVQLMGRGSKLFTFPYSLFTLSLHKVPENIAGQFLGNGACGSTRGVLHDTFPG